MSTIASSSESIVRRRSARRASSRRCSEGPSGLRERIAAGNAPDAPGEVQSDRFDFGLVVGYVGFQTNRPEVIREGLGAMRAVRPDDALVQLLQRVWLPDAAEPTRPTSPSER